MVFMTLDDAAITNGLVARLADEGIAVLGGDVMRLVTHMDIDRSAVDRLISVCDTYLQGIGQH